ncbi:MAG: rhamnogalacturonan acetylesterase [Niabella sp.]
MKKIYFLLITLTMPCLISAQRAAYKFDFGNGAPAKGFLKVTAATFYTPVSGYGFDFEPKLTAVRNSNEKEAKDDYITSDRPFYFSVKLPEGNYDVKVLLGDAKGTSVTTIKAECRRLMTEKIETAKGIFKTAFFTVHVKDSMIRTTPPSKVKLKSRERAYFHWDDKLTLEFNNAAPKVCAVEITPAGNIPTIFLAGNSTVVDQAAEPWAAWGQMFPAFLAPGVVSVANYAESGETLKAFKGERRLEKIWSLAKPGDYLFIEFAHNDQKAGGNHLDPFTTYKQTLKEWIAEARKRKITPVLVTSMHRRNFDDAGKIINTLSDYPEAMRQTGKEEKVAVLDLNAMSKTMYEAWGPERSVKAFVHYPANTFPNQKGELKDNTHFNAYGAYELAKCIVQAISRSDLPLKKYISPAFKGFDPAYPDPVENFHLPASSMVGTVKPDGN